MRGVRALAVPVRGLSWSVFSHFVAVSLEVCTVAENHKKYTQQHPLFLGFKVV